MNRRFLPFLAAAVAILLLFQLNSKHLSNLWQWQQSASSHQATESSSAGMQNHTLHDSKPTEIKRPLKIAIAEAMGWHDEVYAAYVHSFFSQPDVEVSLFLKEPRWGMPELLKTFDLPLPEYIYYDINALNLVEPDIIVSVSCEYDLQQILPRLDVLFEKKKTYFFCTAHYAAEWDHHHEWIEPALTKWIEAGLLTIVTLSPHVQKGFHKPGWGLHPWESLRHTNGSSNATSASIPWPPIEVFVPVFPPTNAPEESEAEDTNDVSFAIQGGVTDNRDYSRVMNYLADLQTSDSDADSVSLHIIGSGGWEDSVRDSVPDSVQDSIFFDNNLDYLDYYAYLSTKSALIPAFSKEDYLTWISSSSVPASVIGGIPLIATREMLKSYSYLQEEDVYVQEDGETELDAIKKVVETSDEDRKAKIQAVHAIRDRMVKNNVKIVGGWIEDVRIKMGW